MKAYIELTKPNITWLILMSTAVGFIFGLAGGASGWAGGGSAGGWSWIVALHTLAGTALIASGTSALNQWAEWRSDALMNRTKSRPIPSGRLSPGRAMAFGVALSVAGFSELALMVNTLAGALGLFTLLSYLLVYTPLKLRSPHATTIGAIPGAMPPLIGFAAASGTLSLEAFALFAILFLWQFPHFQAIAWMYRDDYARAGIRMLPVVEPDGASTARQMLWTSAILVPVSVAPSLLDMTGFWYAAGAIVLGVAFLASAVRVANHKTILHARGVLVASVIYLPVLYGLMVLDGPVRAHLF
ncbi:MAG: heme o synthase [Bryobacteraceae bacterium]